MPERHRILFIIGLVLLAIGLIVGFSSYYQDGRNRTVNLGVADLKRMKLTSTAFADDAEMPEKYTCKGQNINPPLIVTGVPNDTKSLALVMHDPDAVSGDFVHWLVWDMPASNQTIAENSVPVGSVQGNNGASMAKYTGPCPPAGTGTHHYIFELYALDTILGLPPDTDRTELQQAMKNHIVDQTTLIGLFKSD